MKGNNLLIVLGFLLTKIIFNGNVENEVNKIVNLKLNKMKRGVKSKITKILKIENLEFESKTIPKHESWILPLFVLTGLRENKSTIIDLLNFAQFFTPRDDPKELEIIAEEITQFVEHSTRSSDDFEKFIKVLSMGSNYFPEPFSLECFYEENEKLLTKYTFNEFSISKYLFYGFNERNWYKNTLETFREYFKGYDIELFVKLFAITSPRNNFKSNLIQAERAYKLFKKGNFFENQGFLPNVVVILNQFRSGDFNFQKDTRNGKRKIMNFGNAILGDKKAVVLDSWVLKAFGLSEEYKWQDKKIPYSPRITEYDLVENYIHRLAEVSNYEPRQIVSMLWSGIRTTNSKYKITKTKEVLKEIYG